MSLVHFWISSARLRTTTLGDLIIKPAGKPVLVPESDKREAINTTEAAKADFDNTEDAERP